MAVRVSANAASCATPAQCTMREARGTALSPERPSDAATHRFPPFGLVNTAWDSQPRIPRRGFSCLCASLRLAARAARRRRLLRRRHPARDRRASCRDATRARACVAGYADRVAAPSSSPAARRAATAAGRRRTRLRRTRARAAMLSRRFSTLSGRPFASSTSSSAACARQPSSVSTGSEPSSLDGDGRSGRDVVAAPRDDDVRVAAERNRFEWAVTRRQRHEREIEPAPREPVEQVVDASLLAQVDLRERATEPAAHGGHETAADAPEPADAHARQRRLPLRAHLLLCRFELAEHRGRVREQDAPLGSELERPRAAHAHEEPRADQALEREDLAADGGLRVAEAAGGGAERALGRDGAERDQVPELDAVPVASTRVVSMVSMCDTCDDDVAREFVRSTRGRIGRNTQECEERLRGGDRALGDEAVEHVVPLPLAPHELRVGEPAQVLRDRRPRSARAAARARASTAAARRRGGAGSGASGRRSRRAPAAARCSVP